MIFILTSSKIPSVPIGKTNSCGEGEGLRDFKKLKFPRLTSSRELQNGQVTRSALSGATSSSDPPQLGQPIAAARTFCASRTADFALPKPISSRVTCCPTKIQGGFSL